ncbi:MAG: hypothetical protein GY778_27760, partial [bacterium]|nr:hypothetical protein [bacterium]
MVLPDESMYTASAADGGGSVTVEPAFVRAAAPCTLTFTYTVGPKGIQPGGAVLCYVTRFWYWAPPQNVAPDRPGFSTVTCSNADARLAVDVDPGNQTIMARVEGTPLTEGDRLTFVYGDTSDGRNPQASGVADRFAERNERFFFKVDGDGDGWFVAVAQQPTFDVQAGAAVRYAVFGPSRAAVGEPFELRVSALDVSNNLVEDHRGRITLHPAGEALAAPTEAAFTPDDRGTVGIDIQPRRPGPTRVAVRDPQDRLPEAISNLIALHEPGREKYRLVWADLQIHGNASDGT